MTLALTPDQLAELQAILDRHIHGGSWHRNKAVEAFFVREGLSEMFGLPDKKKFNRRMIFIASWWARVGHVCERRAQLLVGEFSLLVYSHHESLRLRLCRNHADLDGLVLPADHEFWRHWLPPNSWDCECTVFGARSPAGAVRLGGDYTRQLPSWAMRDIGRNDPVALEGSFLHNALPSLSEIVASAERCG